VCAVMAWSGARVWLTMHVFFLNYCMLILSVQGLGL